MWLVLGAYAAMLPLMAAEPPAAGAVVARMLANSALLGFQMSIEDAAAEDEADKPLMACMKALDSDALATGFLTLLTADMPVDDLNQLDEFLLSPAGKKYEALGRLAAYAAKGRPPPYPKPVYTAAEMAQFENLSKSAAVKEFLLGHWAQKPAVKALLREQLTEKVRGCKES